MRIEQSHACCGHYQIHGLEDIDLKTGHVTNNWGRNGPLSQNLLGPLYYSWIQGQGQSKHANKLASEFKKLKYTVEKVVLGHNPGHSKAYKLIMFVARPSAEEVEKKTEADIDDEDEGGLV